MDSSSSAFHLWIQDSFSPRGRKKYRHNRPFSPWQMMLSAGAKREWSGLSNKYYVGPLISISWKGKKKKKRRFIFFWTKLFLIPEDYFCPQASQKKVVYFTKFARQQASNNTTTRFTAGSVCTSFRDNQFASHFTGAEMASAYRICIHAARANMINIKSQDAISIWVSNNTKLTLLFGLSLLL